MNEYYTKEFKLNAVKTYIGLKGKKSINALSKELNVNKKSLGDWILNYRAHGEEGLTNIKSYVKNGKLKNELANLNLELEELKKANNYLTSEFNNMKKTLGDQQKELIKVTKDRDNMRKAISIFIKNVRDNSVIG